MYPGNVLILDTAIAPCQDMPEMRVASPRAASACPGTFPRSTSSSRPPHPSCRPKRRDLSFPETQSPGPKPGRGASPWAPFSPETQLVDGNRFTIGEPTRVPRPTCPATRAGTGSRPYQHHSTIAQPGRGNPLWLPVSPKNQLVLDRRRTQPGVVAQGFNRGIFSPRTTTRPGGAP